MNYEINIQIPNEDPKITFVATGPAGPAGAQGAAGVAGDFDSITTEKIVNDAVTFDKIQNVNSSRILGRKTAGDASIEQLTASDALEILGLSDTSSRANIAANTSGTADTVKVTANTGTGETNKLVFIGGAAGATVAGQSADVSLQNDTDLTYNPGTGILDVPASGGVQAGKLVGPTDTDLRIESDKNITFVADLDEDDDSALYSFKYRSTQIASLDQGGSLQIDGSLDIHGDISMGGTGVEFTIDSGQQNSSNGSPAILKLSSFSPENNAIDINSSGGVDIDAAGDLNIDTTDTSDGIKVGTATSGVPVTIGHGTSETTIGDNLTVNGNLTVSGTTTTVNSTIVNLNDHNIVLDSGNTTSSVINNAGITIEGGTGDDAKLNYSTSSGGQWEFKLGDSFENVKVDGLISTSFTLGSSTAVTSIDTDISSVSGSDDTLASAKAIKAYVDSQSGDITAVTAGSGLTGGGNSGDVTLNIGAGNLIDIQADQVDVDLTELTDMTESWTTSEDEFVVLDNGVQKRKLSSEIFGSNAFNSTTIGTTTNALTVDDSSIQLNSGTTFDGSATRTISVKNSGITNDMLNGSIADTKLNSISTANKVAISALDIDGGTDIGEALVDADLFIVDNGANGTNRKATMSTLKTYALSGNATTASSLATARDLSLTGDVTATLSSFDGSGNVSATATIAADAVHASMINDDLISGSASALTSGLANDDELLISDNGVLKNMDVSVLQTYMQDNLSFTTNSDVDVNVTNLTARLPQITENVTIGDAADVVVSTSGNLTVGGDILVTGNDIKDAAGNTIVSSDGSGNIIIGAGAINGNAATGTNQAGGSLNLKAGTGTGSGTSGSITFFGHDNSGSPGTGTGSLTEVASIDGSGNLQIDGDLTVSGNDIKDNDGTTCITFDSSGNTTIANTLNATLTGNVTGNVSGSAATVTGAAQSNITSLGTLTSLTVDSIVIDGTTISHTSLTDILTFNSSGSIVTVKDGAYDFDIASHDGTNGLKLGGTTVTSTAAELNILDGVIATTAEINLIDGDTARGTNAVSDGDGFLHNDAGTMRMTNVSKLADLFAGTGLTAASSVISIDTTVATLTGSQTLTNKTLTSPDINGGTIDGATIDATTTINGTAASTVKSGAAAGATALQNFSSLSASDIPNISTDKLTSGTLPVSRGGTNATSFADKSVIITQDSDTDTLSAAVMDTNGQLLIGGTSGPAVAVPTGGDGLTVTVGDGTLEYDLDASLTTVTSILNTTLAIGRDDHNKIDFSTDNQIKFKTNNETPVIIMKASGEIEATKFDGALEGNADTATVLETARTIGGVSFNGGANIDLAGVNIVGNQNTTGTSAGISIAAASGTDAAGTNANIKAGQSTGNKNGGKISFQTSKADTSSGSGTNSLTEIASIDHDGIIGKVKYQVSTSQQDAGTALGGDVVFLGDTNVLDKGKIYYLNTDSDWDAADADAESTAKGMLGVALADGKGENVGLLLRGIVTLSNHAGTSPPVGSPIYLSLTAGEANHDVSSYQSGDIIRSLGYVLKHYTDRCEVYFNPDNTYIEI